MKPIISKTDLLLLSAAGIVALGIGAFCIWHMWPSIAAVVTKEATNTAGKAADVLPAPTKEELQACQHRWQEIAPIYQSYAQRQREVRDRFVDELKNELVAMRERVNTSRFAEEVMSLNTMGHTLGTFVDDVFGLEGENAFSDPEEINRFLKDTFFEHVVDIDDINQLISGGIAAANSEFIQNSNQLLIDCDIDTSFDPEQLGLEATDLSEFQSELESALPSMESLLKNAFASNILTTVGGIAAGGAALKAAKGGNAHSMLVSLGIGALGDFVGTHVTSELLETEETIIDESRDIAMQLMGTFLDDQSRTLAWTKTIELQCNKHVDQCGQFLADHIQVSRSLPVDSLK